MILGGLVLGMVSFLLLIIILRRLGPVSALRAGVAVSAVRCPLAGTRVVCEREKNLCGKPVEATEA